jgi:hypothetical protein
MAEILNLLPPDILQVETPQHIHKQEAVVPAKPDDDPAHAQAVDAVFTQKQEELSPAVIYALWSGAAILGDMARDYKRREAGEIEPDGEPEDVPEE